MIPEKLKWADNSLSFFEEDKFLFIFFSIFSDKFGGGGQKIYGWEKFLKGGKARLKISLFRSIFSFKKPNLKNERGSTHFPRDLFKIHSKINEIEICFSNEKMNVFAHLKDGGAQVLSNRIADHRIRFCCQNSDIPNIS